VAGHARLGDPNKESGVYLSVMEREQEQGFMFGNPQGEGA
jgi:hypothetical protein